MTHLLLAFFAVSALFADSQMNEAMFQRTANNFTKKLQPLVQERHAHLEIQTFWTAELLTRAESEQPVGDDIVEQIRRVGGATSWRRSEVWYLGVTGGIARHHAITRDALELVLCHELGHLMVPDIRDEDSADYYATSACLKELWRHDLPRKNEVPAELSLLCKEDDLCERIGLAAHGAAVFLYEFYIEYDPKNQLTRPSFASKAKNYKDRAQCRLENLMSGATGGPLMKCQGN